MIERYRRLYLTPDDDAHAAICDLARAATVSLHALIYAINLPDLAAILVERRGAGLAVGVVADRTQAAGKAERAILAQLRAGGVAVVLTSAPSGHIMHTKAMLVDMALGTEHNASQAAYGSYNFTVPAQAEDNVLIVDNDPGVCALLWRQYQAARDWGMAHVPQGATP